MPHVNLQLDTVVHIENGGLGFLNISIIHYSPKSLTRRHFCNSPKCSKMFWIVSEEYDKKGEYKRGKWKIKEENSMEE